jgi:hypothetical protein
MVKKPDKSKKFQMTRKTDKISKTLTSIAYVINLVSIPVETLLLQRQSIFRVGVGSLLVERSG